MSGHTEELAHLTLLDARDYYILPVYVSWGVLPHARVHRAKCQLSYSHMQVNRKCNAWGTHHVGEGFGWGSPERAAGANGP